MDPLEAATRELLSIDSATGGERALCDHVLERFTALEPHAVLRAGNSLFVAPHPPDRSRERLMLLGHLDTVPKLSENPVRKDGDRLFGLGASDMKGALAVMLEVLAAARRRRPPRVDVSFVFYAREEGPYADSDLPNVREAAREWFDATNLAVCLEPTDNRIELGCMGTLHASVTFSGRRAHSARPWQGENAIHKAAGLLGRLAALKPVEHRLSGLTFVEVMSATLVEARGARNVVPDRFTLNVNYRFAPGKDETQARRDLDALIQGEAAYELTDFCPSGRVCADNPLLDALRAAAGNPETAAKQAWTDVGRLCAWGLDAINFGPGATAQAHQADEWVSVPELRKSYEAFERLLYPGSA